MSESRTVVGDGGLDTRKSNPDLPPTPPEMKGQESEVAAWSRSDRLALFAVLLAILIFQLPILLGRFGIFLDDIRIYAYPNAVFQANCLKRGIIPLWEPHTFAGGYPFYLRVDAMNFYLPQWLVGLLGTSSPSDRAYHELVLIPVAVHYLWAALGAFLLGRRGLRLSTAGGGLLALSYALSTSMLAGLLNPPMTIALAWHPWLLAMVLIYARQRRGAWLVGGAVTVALAAPTWIYYTLEGLFLAAIFALASVIRCWLREGRRSAVRLAGGLVVMGGLGILLAAPFWWAVAEGTGYVGETIEINYDFLTYGHRSVPLRWLATFFIPELFSSTNFSHMWGIARDNKMYWCEAFLTRGMFLWLPAVLAIWLGLRSLLRPGWLSSKRAPGRPRTEENGRELDYDCWTWVSTGLLILSILVMLGRHTLVFGCLSRIFPLFRMPYATRWHPVYTMSLSILIGLGVTRILAARKNQGAVVSRWWMIGYAVFVTLLAGAAVGLPIGYFRKNSDLGWFWKVPGVYWACSVVLLILLFGCWRRRWAGRAIVVLAFLSLIRSAVCDAYRPMGVTWAPEQEQTRGPEDTEMYQFVDLASRFDTDPWLRTGYSRILADNGAMLYGGLSLLGWAVKPMLPRMYHVLEGLCDGWPNELLFRDPTLPFVRNMSVGSWWYNCPTPPDRNWRRVTAAPPRFGLYLFRVPDSLPRVFTLDRLQPASETDQRHDLIYRDLHEVVVVDQLDQEANRLVEGRRGPVAAQSVLPYFSQLQAVNKILRAEFSRPNQVVIDADLARPAMLVITDAWHPGWRALVDGKASTIHRVNYLQRGVWLREGKHTVEMRFEPAAFSIGSWFFLGAFIVSMALLCGSLIKGRGRNRRSATGSGEQARPEAP